MRLIAGLWLLACASLAAVPAALAQSAAPNSSSTGLSPSAAQAIAQQQALDLAAQAYREGRFGDALSDAESLASRGNGKAATLAGIILEQGLSAGATPEAAVRWYRRATLAGDSDGMLGLARMGVNRRGGATPQEGLAALQRAAAQGREEAFAPLADLLISGAAGPRDRGRAAGFYVRAAAKGDAEAAYAAAILYADGDPDLMDDPLKAVPLLKQAAEAGRGDAAADYGLMLYQGRGVARDLASAANWFKLAAERGDKDGAFYFALVSAKGEGTPQNLPVALEWARAARGSSPEADQLLAQLERATRASGAPVRP